MIHKGQFARRVAAHTLFVTTALTLVTPLVAQVATLDERLSGAERVVVATTGEVTASWRENSLGDRLIVSRVRLDVEETIKGTSEPTVWMEVEGGTLDGFTLRVSSLPFMQQGERAVFFLDPAAGGIHRPHLRGQGILFLDNQDFVRGSSLRLADIRSHARGSGR